MSECQVCGFEHEPSGRVEHFDEQGHFSGVSNTADWWGCVRALAFQVRKLQDKRAKNPTQAEKNRRDLL